MLRPLLTSSLLLACKSPAPAQPPEPTPSSPELAQQDRDAGGVADDKDACPDGCPEKNRDGDDPIATDGDGLLDSEDRCPAEIETKNGYLDRDGCPDEIPPDLATITGIIKGIYFVLGKDRLHKSSAPVLDRVVLILKQYPDVRIRITGHRDDTGAPSFGHDLSKRRPNSIKRYLVEHGIDEARIETRGAGPDQPIDTNKTAAGRANNRRIEFTLLVD